MYHKEFKKEKLKNINKSLREIENHQIQIEHESRSNSVRLEQIENELMTINNKKVETSDAGIFVETYAPQGPFRNQPRCSNNPKKFGEVCEKFRVKSTLPDGRSFFNLDTFPGENIGNSIYNVPSGHYFFIGDNRDNSLDSRIGQIQGGVGFVPYENLVGRADRVMFSSAGRSMLFFWTWRSDRFFKAVQ